LLATGADRESRTVVRCYRVCAPDCGTHIERLPLTSVAVKDFDFGVQSVTIAVDQGELAAGSYYGSVA